MSEDGLSEFCNSTAFDPPEFQEHAYTKLLLVPIYVIIGVCYSIVIVISILRLVLWPKQWNVAKKFREADRKMIAYMLETFFNMLHHREGIRELEDLSDAKEMKCAKSNGNELDSNEVISSTEKSDHNVEISHSTVIDTDVILLSKTAVTILSWYVANVTSLAIVVFWDLFIVKHKIGCDDEMDCFYANGTYIDKFCFCLPYEERFSASCYEISLEFPQAIAEVTGILFLAFNGFAFMMFLKLLIADGATSLYLRIVMYVCLGFFEYIIICGIIGAFVARGVLKEDTTNTIIEQVLISVSLVMGVTVPWILFIWASRKVIRRKKAMNSKF